MLNLILKYKGKVLLKNHRTTEKQVPQTFYKTKDKHVSSDFVTNEIS